VVARIGWHRALHQPNQGTEPPEVPGLDGFAIALTVRESQFVELAGRV
jgi:hypothetical protein